MPAVIAFRKFDEPQVQMTGSDFTDEAIAAFVQENAFPLLGSIGPENYQKYVERGFPMVWVFVDASKDEAVLEVARTVAKEHKQLSFVQLDGIRWADHSKSFGLNGQTPGLVIEDREHRKNYVFPQSEEVTVEALDAHVASFTAGSLSATVRSEPIPETNDAPVRIVVGKTFDSIVMDTSKDVLLEFYAPWCGHCKSLVPKYEKLAEEFASTESVVIAKIDATENDTPIDIRGFPTIIFFPADNKESPITYDGDRTEEAMGKFVRANAATLKGSVDRDEL